MNNTAKSMLQISDVGHDLRDQGGPFVALRDINLNVAGRVRHADRPLGLRQVDAAEPGRRPDHADQRRAAAAPTARSPARARSARVVFQNHSLLPWLTCFDNVYLAVERVFGATESKAQLQASAPLAALELVGLTPRRSTSARTRSPAA